MSESSNQVRDACALVAVLITALVDKTDEISVTARIGGEHATIHVSVAESDIGKVIGKQGRTARSLRTIIAAYSMKTGRRFMLDIAGGNPAPAKRFHEDDREVTDDTPSLEDRGLMLGSYAS
jgi:predicted RNA-binding protein YlqC (UPF0109 family)